jgi:hypothetical protein
MNKKMLMAFAVLGVVAAVLAIGAMSGVASVTSASVQTTHTPQGSHMNGCEGMMTGQGCSHMMESNGNQCQDGEACAGGCSI